MNRPILFLDTETTGLTPEDEIWEVAAVLRAGGHETVFHAFVQHDVDKAANLPASFAADHAQRYDPDAAITPAQMCERLLSLMEDRPHVIGAVPNFDTERLARLFRYFGYDTESSWHYHLVDIETLVVGCLLGKYGIRVPLPWDSKLISLAVGIKPSGPGVEHTAMGDVQWVMKLWDAVMT